MVKGNKRLQTEIGLLPEDWEVKTLQEIGSFSKGKGISKSEANSGEIPAVRYGELYTKHNNVIKRFYSFIDSQVARNSTKLKKGDILFAGSGETKEEIGKSVAFVSDSEIYVGGDIVLLSPNRSCQSMFLGYLLNSNEIQKQKAANAQGDAVVHIYSSSLKDIKIPLPPLHEQEAIASALSDADVWIESLEKLIAKKRLIKQGAMQELLTPKEDWEVKKLGDVAESFSGGTPSTSNEIYYNGNISFITSGELNQQRIKSTYYTITQEGLDNSSAKLVNENSLLIAMYGATAGVVAINEINGAINQAVLAVVPNKYYSVEFLFYFFNLKKEFIINTYTQGGQPNLSGGILKKIEIPFPSLTEQTRIATILSDMDAELEALSTQLEKAKKIKQGMIQELLTGRIRLV